MVKKLLFYMGLMMVVILAVEIVSLLYGFCITNHLFSYSYFNQQKKDVIQEIINEHNMVDEEGNINLVHINCVPHPYFGYVSDPTILLPEEDRRLFNLYHCDDFIIPWRSKDRIVILVMGGSVAWDFASKGLKRFLEPLKQYPQFKNKEILVFRSCFGGYKQPQQLLILNYLLSLGGYYDVVINIDGFNEIALSLGENVPNGVNPFYPRRWDLLMPDTANPQFLKRIGRKIVLEEKRLSWARLFHDTVLRYSAAMNLLWRINDNILKRQVVEAKLELATSVAPTIDQTVKGPPAHPAAELELINRMAKFWANCSIQMNQLCDRNGIDYYHILQPNQYAPDSKPFSSEEQSNYRNNPIYKSPAQLGYPRLIERGGYLHEHNVKFFDLSSLFKDTSETVYRDDCCHYNDLGQRLFGERIADIIGSMYTPGNAPDSPPFREETEDQVIVSQGAGGRSMFDVRLFNKDLDSCFFILKSLKSRFPNKPGAFCGAVYVTAGDVNNDGVEDIVTTFGPKRPKPPFRVINLFVVRDGKSGDLISHPFNAFPPKRYTGGEVHCAVGDFIGSPTKQIAFAQGVDGANTICLFQYEGKPRPYGWKHIIKGVSAAEPAPSTDSKPGLTLAAGDLNGDGRDELLTGENNSPDSTCMISVLRFSEDGRVASRHSIQAFPAAYQGNGGINIAAGDLNGDGKLEIVAASQGNSRNHGDARDSAPYNLISIIGMETENGKITGFNQPVNNVLSVFPADINPSGCVNLAIGELDGDRTNGEELILGTGALIDADETSMKIITPAPRAKIRVLKVLYSDNKVEGIIDILREKETFLDAFREDRNPESGAVYLSVLK